jgi:hypothetical protein
MVFWNDRGMQTLGPLTFSNFVILNYYFQPHWTIHGVIDCKFQTLQTVNRNVPLSKKTIHKCFDMDMSYTRVLHIKVAYRVPHK